MSWTEQSSSTGTATTWDSGTTTWDSGSTTWDAGGAAWASKAATAATWTEQTASS